MSTDRTFRPAPLCDATAWRRLGLACMLCLLTIGAACADDDLPARVGRVALLQGGLFLAPEDQGNAWSTIGLNYTITSGDNLWVDPEGHAEIDYGGGQFRLGSDTNVHVSRLDDHQLALFIAQGKLIVRVRFLDPGESAHVDTPNSQVALLRTGLYRIDVSPDRQHTVVMVREGEANVALGSGVQQVLPGQSATVDGADAPMVAVRNGGGVDGFDTWSASRDRYYERGTQTPYVSRQMVGYADLDQYGGWETYPEYGAVWFPANVVMGWAPYRYGYWTALPGWGSTWVDEAPWGYAPFHYGRWVFVGTRWGWCPGTFVPRPAWAPALVAWYGGTGWSMSVNGGPVYGWVPLSWREPFHPWWSRCSAGCWNRYNRPYAVDLQERTRAPATRYVNGSVPGAMTAVSRDVLVRGRPVQANLVRVPSNAVASAPLLRGTEVAQPQRIAAQTVRPGTNGAPAPASTFNPVTRLSHGGGGQAAVAPGAPASIRQASPTGAPGTAVPGAMPAYRSAPATGTPGPAYDGRANNVLGGAAPSNTPAGNGQVRPAPAYASPAGPVVGAPGGREFARTPETPHAAAALQAPASPAAPAPPGRSLQQQPATTATLPPQRPIRSVPQAQAPVPVERSTRGIPLPQSMTPARAVVAPPVPQQAAPVTPQGAPQVVPVAPAVRVAPAPEHHEAAKPAQPVPKVQSN